MNSQFLSSLFAQTHLSVMKGFVKINELITVFCFTLVGFS